MIGLWLLILLPGAAGILAFFIRRHIYRRALWVAAAALHAALTIHLMATPQALSGDAWIGVDALSLLFLALTSLLFLVITLYSIAYVAHESAGSSGAQDPKWLLYNTPEVVFTGCVLLFLASMSLVILGRHFGLQWVAIEATTLVSAPLIYFHRNPRSLEAAWKYLLICSIAIALALMGVFFIALSVPKGIESFTIDSLIRNAGRLNVQWLETGFIFLLVGYGTKMGLAPMHTWLPDAHGEAPSPVSALLSGALLNCAFLGILRLLQLCNAAGIGDFGRHLLVFFGLLSMGIGSLCILRQPDYKRMLAYSSVEHMGILAFGVGLGSTGVFGSLLHVINHSLVKTTLFLTSGNILAVFHSKQILDVRGLCRVRPVTGVLWMAGLFAIAGMPPFGTFVSEFTIVKTALAPGHWVLAGAFVLFLAIAFAGMLGAFQHMALGAADREQVRESWSSILPPVALILLSLMLGLWLPANLTSLLRDAAVILGGSGL